MAIDPNLLVLKPVSELETVNNPTTGSLLFYDGGYELKKTSVADFYNAMQSAYLGIATTTTTPPATGAYWYRVDVPGTYMGVMVTAADLFDGTNYYDVTIEVKDNVAVKRKREKENIIVEKNVTNNTYNLDPAQIVPSEALYNNPTETLAGDIIKRVDINTGENVNYRETTTWHDGSAMDDSKADGVIYIKKGSKYYKRQYEGFINVKWFGAKGDGITDDTEAFEKAILFKKVIIPNGIYIVKSIMIDSNDIELIGEGKNTIIKSSAEINDHLLNISGENISVKKLTLDANGNNMPNPNLGDGASCLNIVYSNKIVIDNIIFKNPYNKTSLVVGSKNVTIENCKYNSNGFLTNNQDFIQFYGNIQPCIDCIVRNNTFENMVRAGIYTDYDVQNLEIYGNRFENNLSSHVNSAGIILQGGADQILIRNNYFKSVKQVVYMRCGGRNIYIKDNNIKDLKSKILAIYDAQNIYDLIKNETGFVRAKKTINIEGSDYVIVGDNVFVENNAVEYSNSLLESDTSIVSIILTGNYNSFVENINVIGNNILKGNQNINSLIFNHVGLNNKANGVFLLNNNINQPHTFILNSTGASIIKKINFYKNLLNVKPGETHPFVGDTRISTDEVFASYSSQITGTLDFGATNTIFWTPASYVELTSVVSKFEDITIITGEMPSGTKITNVGNVRINGGSDYIVKNFETINLKKSNFISESLFFSNK